MCTFEIEGGKSLNGEVSISRAKNSALLLMCASVLIEGEVYINDCPKIGDVNIMCQILNSIGVITKFEKSGLYINSTNITTTIMPKALTKKIRASFFLVGAMVSRLKEVTISIPGGCNIGARPIDIHLDGLKKLGAKVEKDLDTYKITASKIQSQTIILRYPSVGATANLIMAAAVGNSEVQIQNPAKEPEIVDLANFINFLGGKVYGAGSNKITVKGATKLHSQKSYTPIPDRVEGATFLLLACQNKGQVLINNINYKNIYYLTKKIVDYTCKVRGLYVKIYNDKIYIKSRCKLNIQDQFTTSPYPGFPTDMQQLICCMFAGQVGSKIKVKEKVFENRFNYLFELEKMGAKFDLKNNQATIFGTKLVGAKVVATDLRAGAGLVLAGLNAQGKTKVLNAEVILRGYENLDKKLLTLGAKVALKGEFNEV